MHPIIFPRSVTIVTVFTTFGQSSNFKFFLGSKNSQSLFFGGSINQFRFFKNWKTYFFFFAKLVYVGGI